MRLHTGYFASSVICLKSDRKKKNGALGSSAEVSKNKSSQTPFLSFSDRISELADKGEVCVTILTLAKQSMNCCSITGVIIESHCATAVNCCMALGRRRAGIQKEYRPSGRTQERTVTFWEQSSRLFQSFKWLGHDTLYTNFKSECSKSFCFKGTMDRDGMKALLDAFL